MMNLNDENFSKFYDELNEMHESIEKVKLIQNALKWAAEIDEHYYEFVLRFALANTSGFVGDFDELFDNYFWCLEFFENNEDELEEWVWEMLWGFKWVLEHLPKIPTVEKEFIETVFVSFKEYCERYNFSLRPYFQYRHRHYRMMGDTKKAEEYFELWFAAERDDLSDCLYCEKNQRMEFLFDLGRFEEAFELGEELITSENDVCEEIPNLTYSKLLLPLYREGLIDKAKEYQTKGYFLVYQKQYMLLEAAEHIIFLSLTDVKKAFSVYKRHLEYADSEANPHGMFYFYLASLFMIEKYKEQGKVLSIDVYEYRNIVQAIADDFDEANGNNYYNELISQVMELK